MPLDDEIIEEIPLEGEEITPDSATGDPVDIDDPQIGDDESLVQDGNDDGSDSGSEAPESEYLEPGEIPEAEFQDPDLLDPGLSVSDNNGPGTMDDFGSISGNDLMQQLLTIEKSLQNEASDVQELDIYTDLEAFETSTIQVDLYQYTILNRLEFIQYALCIVIALLFLQIFVRYKK